MDSGLLLIKALAATLLTELDTLNLEDMPVEIGTFDLNKRIREFEIKMIRVALLKTGGNQRRAASLLGLKSTTLHNKIRNYGINSIEVAAN